MDEVKDKVGKSVDVASWEQKYVNGLSNEENGCVLKLKAIKIRNFRLFGGSLSICMIFLFITDF
jgi:hypothetical protein